MDNYQFFKRNGEGQLVHLDVDSKTYYHEKEQLINQGFETYGDTIQAATTKEAYQRANSMIDEAVQQYGMANPVGGLFYFVTGMYELLFKKKNVSKLDRD
jgi:hypothetical protein